MSHSSPASYLVWSLITALLGSFLLFHLWSFDRFKCLRWNSGAGSGAFKRIMTYSYLVTVPMILIYAVGNAIIKYREGFIAHPIWELSQTLPVMGPRFQGDDFPIHASFSIGWSFEMVTHLEELCFWLFLINSGSGQQNWFKSLYFRTWVIGSTIAVIYMPVVTIVTRADPLKSEAFTFLAGSLGSLSLTLWFTPILWTFPSFLNNLRLEGVDVATIVRLTKFSEMNMIRVVFRFLFTVPLLILGVDGVRPHVHINESMLWTDFLSMVAGFGCCISSGITLVIFFPRSIEGEIAARDEARERKRTKSFGRSTAAADAESVQMQTSSYGGPISTNGGGTYLLTSSPVKQNFDLQSLDGGIDDPAMGIPYRSDKNNKWEDERRDIPSALPPITPNRKKTGRDIEMGSLERIESLTETNLSVHNLRQSNVNPMISNFKSPIEIMSGGVDSRNGSRLTFSRR
ncbi:hypothetical protein BJ912DRAFT_109745 [Pholiota molesta]|nr:hypothetical protein BJ912DRAFT_109745 [Pholiota molesta]